MTMTTRKPPRTALEVYQAGYQNQRMRWGGYMLASRDFFQELRQAICYELEHDGFCTLVDDLREQISFRPADGCEEQLLCAQLEHTCELGGVQSYGVSVCTHGRGEADECPACQRCGA